ncbi:hypothetical protein GCM10022261_11010 [Brevibacterium daeguense]|uniref:Na+/H+ antiporter subunit E n=1 Tax=Brevibacterium daeguense TaxID=909936 RepID=A0ABP8EHZ8_9MICO|nr:Na+/H+ antiporter subunit E [Brevibacterium daeguense]
MIKKKTRRPLWQIALPILLLTAVWIMLWDDLSVLNILTGVLLALFVTRFFYLPPVELSRRFNIFWAAVFLGWFTASMISASLHVAWLAVRPKGVSAGSVISVELHTRSDLLITMVSTVIGLIPGSIVIEADRAHSVIFVHVLDCSTDDEVEAAKSQVYRIENLLIRALGSAHDITTLNTWRKELGMPPVLPTRELQRKESRR